MALPFSNWLRNNKPLPCQREERHVRLRFEQLEDRTLLSVAPYGSEFLVNQTTTGAQSVAFTPRQAVAMDSVGNYVVTWHSKQTGNFDIYARLYFANGTPRTDEFHVNTHTPNDQSLASVAMDAD